MNTNEPNISRYPLVHATVLRTITQVPVARPEHFKRSTLVRVRNESKFAGQHPLVDGTGQIVAIKDDEPGWAYVRFIGETPEQRFINRYRIGTPELDGGACDLELDAQESLTFAVVQYTNQTVEIPIIGFLVEPGDIVKIDPKANRVVATEKGIPSGSVAFIYRIVDANYVEVDFQGNRRTVYAGKFSGALESDGRVVLDSTGSVIIQNYGLDDDSFALQEDTLITWDDISGQEEARHRFNNALVMPELHPDAFKAYKKKAPKGFLLWGPPGCGKTLLGKAVYSSIAQTCREKGAPVSQGFILVSGPEILDKYVGATEATIRHIFARARKFYQKWGIRPIIMIDEGEAILARRDSGISSDILKTVVPMFLAQMDGVRSSGAIVIIATNKPGSLDSAVTRPGRVDAKIEVKRPNKEAAEKIFRHNMRGLPVQGTLDELVAVFVEEMFSPENVIYDLERHTEDGKVEVIHFCLSHIISGAMVAGIVEEAKQIALDRDTLPGATVTGVSTTDVEQAVQSMFRQSFAEDHQEALGDFTVAFAERVSRLTKRTQMSV